MNSLLASPLESADDASATMLEVTLAGQMFRVKAGRQQVLNLLVSTFENAVAKNQELVVANQDLSVARDGLQKSNEELSTLNAEISRINAHMVRDLKAAAKVQRSLLPADDVEIPGTTIAWRYVPCQGLAGDFLNVFPLDEEHVGLFVVDVSGHGVPSSLMAVTVGRPARRSRHAAQPALSGRRFFGALLHAPLRRAPCAHRPLRLLFGRPSGPRPAPRRGR
jgi:sigma-B regulation protein RsbU (phosphoserine phosphatase)